VAIGCTFRHSRTGDLVLVGWGVGDGLADFVGVGLADFVGVGLELPDFVGVGSAEGLLEGDAEELAEVLPEALGVAGAELLADALGVAVVVDFGLLLALAEVSALGVDSAAARTTLVCPAGTERAAADVAGG
jgi:hypothetical protein